MDEAAVSARLKRLRADFPAYSIGIVTTYDRMRFLGQRRRSGPGRTP